MSLEIKYDVHIFIEFKLFLITGVNGERTKDQFYAQHDDCVPRSCSRVRINSSAVLCIVMKIVNVKNIVIPIQKLIVAIINNVVVGTNSN